MFENKTAITREKLAKASMIYARPLILILIIASVFLILVTIGAAITSEEGDIAYIFSGLLAIFFISIVVMIPRSSKKQYDKTAMFAGEPFYEYSFDREYLKIQYSSATLRSSQVAKWQLLMRITETKDMFLFFIQNNQVYIIEKSGFSKGTPEDFRMFLREICPAIPYKITQK